MLTRITAYVKSEEGKRIACISPSIYISGGVT